MCSVSCLQYRFCLIGCIQQIVNRETLGNAVIARQMLLKVVPIFVTAIVWLLRVLIIGLFSVAGEKYFGGIN